METLYDCSGDSTEELLQTQLDARRHVENLAIVAAGWNMPSRRQAIRQCFHRMVDECPDDAFPLFIEGFQMQAAFVLETISAELARRVS